MFEFRNRNQYVAAPGSIHPNGSLYRWLEDVPVIAMPDWLVDALEDLDSGYRGTATSDHIKTGTASALKDAYAYHCNPEDMFGLDLEIASNARHYTLVSVAGFLHDGNRTREDVLDILKRIRDEYCQSPEDKGDAELERIADHVIKGEPCRIEPYDLPTYNIGLRVFDTAEHMGEWIAQNIDSLDIKPATPKTSNLQGDPNDWRGLFHTKAETISAPSIEYAIDGFLQEGGVSMLGGLPGHGKTLVALEMVRALLEGAPLFGHFKVPRPANRVVYLIPESGLTPFAHRLKVFRLVDHVEDRFFFRTFSIGGEDVSTNLLLDPRMRKACDGADVILDTAVRFMEGDENAAMEQKIFARNLFSLLKAGARTVTGLHHSPKSFERDNYMSLENVLRGSGDIGAMLAACWGIFQIDKASNRLFIENVKARDFQPCDPFVIEGRPHIDLTGSFKMSLSPGLAGSFNKLKPRKAGKRASGRPETPDKDQKKEQAQRMRDTGISDRQIAKVLEVDHKTVAAWLGDGE